MRVGGRPVPQSESSRCDVAARRWLLAAELMSVSLSRCSVTRVSHQLPDDATEADEVYRRADLLPTASRHPREMSCHSSASHRRQYLQHTHTHARTHTHTHTHTLLYCTGGSLLAASRHSNTIQHSAFQFPLVCLPGCHHANVSHAEMLPKSPTCQPFDNLF